MATPHHTCVPVLLTSTFLKRNTQQDEWLVTSGAFYKVLSTQVNITLGWNISPRYFFFPFSFLRNSLSSEAKPVPRSLPSKWSSKDLDKAQSLTFTWQASGAASWLGRHGRNQLAFCSFRGTAAVPGVITHPLYWHKNGFFPSSHSH